jgi:hypothetical protein
MSELVLPGDGVSAYPQSMQIGDFLVDATWVQVPGGRIPIAGTSWRLNDVTAYQRTTPTYAIVLALLLIPCTAFLSLLFLLMKESSVGGLATVELSSRVMTFSTTVPIGDARGLDWLRHAVHQAQTWSFAALNAG